MAGKPNHFFNPFEIEIPNNLFGKPGRFNPRSLNNKGFSAERMNDLRLGIQKDGLNHALLVRINKNKKPSLVAGERRLRAILSLLEADETAKENGEQRVICRNPVNGKMQPALEAYKVVECKITECQDETEALRQAIQENTLHENLSDYELLLQCKKMEDASLSRSVQAKTMGVSEAHISQSHSLLNSHPRILHYMEKGMLTRTAALTFINVPKDKIVPVLERAIAITYQEAQQKEKEAQQELEQALDELQTGESALRLSQFTGNHESAKKARAHVARASRNKTKAEEKLDNASEKKQKTRMTVDVINTAAREVDGAGDKLKRPQSMKEVRLIADEIHELLKGNNDTLITNPANQKRYSRRDISLVQGVLDWMLNRNGTKHPLDVIVDAK